MEPIKHQYNFDSATAIEFLRQYGLEKDFKINIKNKPRYISRTYFSTRNRSGCQSWNVRKFRYQSYDYQNVWDTD